MRGGAPAPRPTLHSPPTRPAAPPRSRVITTSYLSGHTPTTFPVRVLALDLGTKLGVCLAQWDRAPLDRDPDTLEHLHFDLSPGRGLGPGNSDRSYRLLQALDAMAASGAPIVAVAYEHVMFMQNTFAALVAGEVAGTVRLWAHRSGLKDRLWGFHPSTVKAASSGHGGASKAGVEASIRKRFGITAGLTEDEADAVGVLCCLLDGAPTTNIRSPSKRKRKPKSLPLPPTSF